MQKYLTDEEEFFSNSSNPEQKFFGPNSLKGDNEFFKDENYIKQDVVRIKNIIMKNGSQSFEILKNNKIELILRSINFTKKEVQFMNSLQGIQLLLNCFKEDHKSVNKIKQEIKKIIK